MAICLDKEYDKPWLEFVKSQVSYWTLLMSGELMENLFSIPLQH